MMILTPPAKEIPTRVKEFQIFPPICQFDIGYDIPFFILCDARNSIVLKNIQSSLHLITWSEKSITSPGFLEYNSRTSTFVLLCPQQTLNFITFV